MEEKLNNQILHTQPPFSEKYVNLVDILKSISMLTNCTVVLYDCVNDDIVFANLSNIVLDSQISEFSNLNLQTKLGKQGMNKMKEICQYKRDFFKNIDDSEKRNFVISGDFDIDDELFGGNFGVSFLGVSVSFTECGNVHYELFKAYTSKKGNQRLEIFNQKNGDRWSYNHLLKRWIGKGALSLSSLEKQVISLSITGQTAKQISEKLGRPEVTIKKAKSRVMQAVNASSMTEAILLLSNYKFR